MNNGQPTYQVNFEFLEGLVSEYLKECDKDYNPNNECSAQAYHFVEQQLESLITLRSNSLNKRFRIKEDE